MAINHKIYKKLKKINILLDLILINYVKVDHGGGKWIS